MLPAVLAIMGSWIDEHGGPADAPLFTTTTVRRLSRDAIEQRLRVTVATAAASCPSLNTKRVAAHTLRLTAAMRPLQAGVDTTVIARWLGHEQISTTNIYIYADMTLKEEAIAKVARSSAAAQGRYQPTDTVIAFLEAL